MSQQVLRAPTMCQVLARQQDVTSAAHDVKKLILSPEGRTQKKHTCAECQQGRGWGCGTRHRQGSLRPPAMPLWSGFIHSLIHSYLPSFSLQETYPSLHPSSTSWTLFLYSKVKFKGRTEGKKSKKRAEKKWPEELEETRESRGHAVRRAIEREVAARHVEPQSQVKSGVQCPLQ